MSSIRLSTLVPDPTPGFDNVVHMPGDFRVGGAFTAATVNVTQALSLGDVLEVGKGMSFTSTATGGALPFVNPATDGLGLVLAGGSSTSTSARVSLFGPQWPNASEAGSIKINAPSGLSLTTGNASASLTLTGDGLVSLPSGSFVVASGKVRVGSTSDATSFSDLSAAASVAGGLAVGRSIVAGSGISAKTLNLADSSSASLITSGGVQAIGTIATASRFTAGDGVTIGTSGGPAGDIRVFGTGSASIVSDGGAIFAKGISAGGDIATTAGMSVTGLFRSINTTEADSDGAGAGVFFGGVSIGKALRVIGPLNATGKITGTSIEVTSSLVISSLDDTLSLGTGRAIFRGGISVDKRAWFGSAVNVQGTGTFGTLASGSVNVTSALSANSVTIGTGGLTNTGPGTGTTLSLSGTTDALIPGNGTLTITNGGLFVGRSVRINQTLRVLGTATFDSVVDMASDLQISSTARLLVRNTADITYDVGGIPTSASGMFSGGVFIAKKLQVGGALTVQSGGLSAIGDITGTAVRTLGDQDSNGLLSGAVYTPGGVAISKRLFVGGSTTFLSSVSISGVVTNLDPTPSLSSSSGSLVLTGGLGVGGSVYSAGSLNAETMEIAGESIFHGGAYFTSAANSNDLTSGSVVCLGGMAVQATVRVGSDLFVGGRTRFSAGADIYGAVRFYDTTESQSLLTGSVILDGGLACKGNINGGGALSINGTATFLSRATFTLLEESQSPSEGAVVFTGGVGVGRNLNVGGACSIGAALSVAGNITSVSGQVQLNTVTVQDTSGILSIRSAAPGLRVTSVPAVSATRYVNSLDLFTLGTSYTDTNAEALQLSSTGVSAYTLMSRASGTGTVRQLLLQAGATNVGQIALNPDGTVLLGSSSADATSPSRTGFASARVSGGLAVQGSVALGGKLALYPSATSSLAVSLRAAAGTGAYDLVLPPALPNASNLALVSTTTGTLSWAEMTTSNPTFQNVTITGAVESDSPTVGSLRVTGGIAASGNVSIGKLLRMFAPNGSDVSIGAAVNSSKYQLQLPPTLPLTNNFALTSSTTGVLSWQEMTTKNPTFESVTITGIAAFVGSGILLNSSTAGSGVRLKAPTTTTSGSTITFTLPPKLPVAAQAPEVLVADAEGNMSFVEQPRIQASTLSFQAANNVVVRQPVTGLTCSSLFKTDVSVNVTTAGAARTALYTLRGYSSSIGYRLFSTSVGEENVGITFTVDDTTGQIFYTSANITGWISTTLRWEVSQIRGSQNTQLLVDGQNNISTPIDFPNLVIQGEQFTREVLVVVYTTDGSITRCMYTVTGILQSDGNWTVQQTALGADAGVVFSVLPNGQVQYVSGNIANWSRTTFQTSIPLSTQQSDARFTRLSVLSNETDALTVEGGVTIGGDLTLRGDIAPKVQPRTGLESANLSLTSFNCVHQYTYDGSAISSFQLSTALIENAAYEISFTLSGATTLSTTAAPSFVSLSPNAPTTYGDVFGAAYLCNINGTPGYARTTVSSFQFNHSSVSENSPGHGFSGTFKLFNVRSDKNVTYSGGGISGFASGSSWWADTTTTWSSAGSLNTSMAFARWRIWIKRVD